MTSKNVGGNIVSNLQITTAIFSSNLHISATEIFGEVRLLKNRPTFVRASHTLVGNNSHFGNQSLHEHMTIMTLHPEYLMFSHVDVPG